MLLNIPYADINIATSQIKAGYAVSSVLIHPSVQNLQIIHVTKYFTQLLAGRWGVNFLVQVVSVDAKLAIVGPGGLRVPTVVADGSEAGHCFHLLFLFFLFFFFFFIFSAFYFSPTSGNLPCVKICLPQNFGITRRYMQKKNIFFR